MTLYFGIPVSYEEALRIFRINKEEVALHSMKKFNIKVREKIYDHHYFEYIKSFLNNKNSEIKIYATDKSQYIIGYIMEENSDINKKYVNVDETIILLLQLKLKFTTEMDILNTDLTNIKLEYIKGDKKTEIIINNPMPYVICWNRY
jgi:hypothetical protein